MPSSDNAIKKVTTKAKYRISRSGCKTCRQRRVRCDQESPKCRNCTSTGRKCDGVDNINFIFVNGTSPTETRKRTPSASPPPLALTPRKNQTELRSFHVFHHAASPLFAANSLDDPFWQKLVPASAQEIPFVWDASVAIGRLFEHQMKNPGQEWRRDSQLSPSHLQALQYYSRAVVRSKQFLNQNTDQILLALLSCSLFASCEFQQGNTLAGGILLEHSLSLFRTCVSPEALSRSPSSITEALEEALIPFHSRHALTLASLGLPHMFRLMEGSALSGHPHSFQVFRRIVTDFDACRQQLYNLLCRTHFVVRSANLVKHRRDEIVRMRNLSSELLVHLNDWHDQFERLVEPNNTTSPAVDAITDQCETISRAYLLAHFHVARIEAQTCHSLVETAYDAHLDDFVAIVEHATITQFSGTPAQQTSFPPFMFGIGPPLYFVAIRCRHPQIRRDALCLLKAIPRSGVSTHWSFLPVVQVAEAIIAYEEGASSNGASHHQDQEASNAVGKTQPTTQSTKEVVFRLPASPKPRLNSRETGLDVVQMPPEHRRVHHAQLIIRPRRSSHRVFENDSINNGSGVPISARSGHRELALRFITYHNHQAQLNGTRDDGSRIMQPVEWDLPPDIAVGLH